MAGRPKRQFSVEEKQLIEEYALDNCHIDTISLALGIAKNTLIRHYGTFIKKKRAEGRVRLRGYQTKLAKSNPAMAIFLGKNELDQTDKQIIVDETQARQLTEQEQAEAHRLATIRLREGA
jgi:hypothetical protein